MCGSFGGAVHVNSGVPGGLFFKVRKILDIQPIFTLRITASRDGELKPRSPGTARHV